MTKISMTEWAGSPAVKVNGRKFFSHRIIEIVQESAGRWNIKTDWTDFVLVGGRAAGGYSNEWYLWEVGKEEYSMKFQSAKKALETIENC